MREGWICLHRKIMSNRTIGPKKPYTRYEAWTDLLMEAAFDDHRALILGRMVDVKRGEVPHSLRTLADRWGWNTSAVKRFLDVLKTETQTKQRTEHGISLLVIENYDTYQTDDLENETHKTEKPKHKRNTDETNITKETKETRKELTTTTEKSKPVDEAKENLEPQEAMAEKPLAVPVDERKAASIDGCSSEDIKSVLEAFPAFFDFDAFRNEKELLFELPLLTKKWEKKFPQVDWLTECEKANDWLLQTGKRKKYKSLSAFLTNWMRRKSESIPNTGNKNVVESVFGVPWNPSQEDIASWKAIMAEDVEREKANVTGCMHGAT